MKYISIAHKQYKILLRLTPIIALARLVGFLDLHCLQMQGISGTSRTSDNLSLSCTEMVFLEQVDCAGYLHLWILVLCKLENMKEVCVVFFFLPGCFSRPRWLSWMRCPTGDQEVAGSTPAEVGNILSWRLIMKYFLRSFSPFR